MVTPRLQAGGSDIHLPGPPLADLQDRNELFFTSHAHFLFSFSTILPLLPLALFWFSRFAGAERSVGVSVSFFGAECGLGSIEHVSRRVENRVLGIGDLG